MIDGPNARATGATLAATAAGAEAARVGVVTSALRPKRSRMLRSVRIAPSSAAGIAGSEGTCS